MNSRKGLKWLTIQEFSATSRERDLDEVKEILRRAQDPNDYMNTHFVIPIKTAFACVGSGIYVHPEQFEKCMLMEDGSEIELYNPEFALILEDMMEKNPEDQPDFNFYDFFQWQ